MTGTRCLGVTIIVGVMSLLCSARIAHSAWIELNHARLVPADLTLTLTKPSEPALPLTVQSQTPGDLKWLVQSLPVAVGQAITAVELCYQAPDEGTFIRQVRLVEARPAYGLVMHDDATALTSPTACYQSPVLNYTVADAVSLWVRLEFADVADAIVIDGIRIQVEEAEQR
jgi:hypothetical protein